jgi:starch synthase (maltosyl-transferring)
MADVQAIEGRRRVAIENVKPIVDNGRFAIKRTVGQRIVVSADVFADGHDVVRAVLLSRLAGSTAWHESPMSDLGNDRWQGEFQVAQIGRYEYTVQGWVDAFTTWHRDLGKRIEAGQDVSADLILGAQLVGQAVERAQGHDADRLRHWQSALATGPKRQWIDQADAAELTELMGRHPDHRFATQLKEPLAVVADSDRARFSTWYELFPRSCAREPGRHGTFRDCIDWLPRLAQMGFDVLYLPPIHPIGTTFRKGKNNAVNADPGDFGCPWAIGSPEGGHKSIHSQLGTLSDLHQLVAAARKQAIDVALDIAFQCSPDHPYVTEHPQWFRHRGDGTIQYAENPPKKYQDIYPFDFENPDWLALWRELTDVVLYWCAQGIRIFRVDNPHTKPFAFWEHLISQVKAQYPETILLSEAFTRPKVMYRLAKLGFTQSYTYFTWRNSKTELTEYFTELTQTNLSDFFRPNLWANTPDILPEHLQTGGRAAFVTRLVLAATLGASYGIYGPAFETLDNRPREPGSEEYFDSEKYQLRNWDLNRPDGLRDVITIVNLARRDNPALQSDASLRFHPTDNEHLLCYSKHNEDLSNLIVVVVNLSFHEPQHGFIALPLMELGINPDRPYRVQDLLNERSFDWKGPRNFVELDPQKIVAHVFRVASLT